MTFSFTATVLGSPRIGPNRELKKAVESYWAGRLDAEALDALARDLRRQTWTSLRDAGLDSVPVNTFSYYDHVLDTAAMLGALPDRVAGIESDLDRYFAAARGNDTVAPLEMTKWFDTNYHYLVPEISPTTTFALDPSKVLRELEEARALDIPARPVVVGPVTFLLLSKAVGSDAPLLDRLDELVPLYADLLGRLADAGADWVQIDEPALVADRTPEEIAAAKRAYDRLSALESRPAILLASYFGSLGDALPAIASTGVEGIAIDLVAGSDTLATVPDLTRKHVVAGVVDGRNIWRTDLDAALASLGTLLGSTGSLAVSTSCSLLHVPYTLDAETGLDKALRSWLAFGTEKVREVVTLGTALTSGRESVEDEFALARAAASTRSTDRRLHDATVRARLDALTASDPGRSPAAERREAQSALSLPVLPTTTIGSYPQTTQIRVARAARRKGEIDESEYLNRMRAEVADVVALQEKLDLDVLVHGEPERNDMVQYFAEQLDGFFATDNGWVQSYGSRCVRPPILYGDVRRSNPMTVEWITYAQSLTQRPVKGMLTGPVTILAWSFVRDDQPLADSANQVALAIRDETVDLQGAGIRIVQVDEPALRELLPLRAADQPAYLDWSVGAFRLATSGVSDSTQIHTHLCYSEFGEVIEAIARLDADVTSIEAARSHMEVLDDLNAVGFDLGVGPGVYDIHSPRVPGVEEIAASLREALKAVPVERLWVNPDCGLKTRGPAEVEASLRNLVDAAKLVRAEL
ncbi:MULTISPECIES: 5-methyltetrahydropteroyltriglutamate--homocysteine S-methyltransferase [Rhodococcus]|uniref:5-methyltetrahydropteroyltriglutamate--homocysteine methyltransferase n=1 Tax=Rhodococcus opacus TaxID=37919 RepID=A0AAX3YJN7_RHOOP|nr:5-methyltetrahydropteroyltriglutamate--homocysteine S-methyltransferase [Rhodococcus opacus]NHU45088.1 5-methyltetrahydropteroyltriglutamate--homocysteine S-methyltransferase [Rhodococcus sp. A14]MBA8958817.1 5-methyltetrahydropteroyltriglutamate--homocysteine methyltransferase [Rhodococcus opacus]MBP2204382.1 5-methyltetrahydropteroyltriglutamate--homocysteine methyltransferase [Rhodococcus opacus]MCZ4585107.1 5-methyltetrahydropteroyltriglutamate--homocysteine S-methyltransferase [Rhodococ